MSITLTGNYEKLNSNLRDDIKKSFARTSEYAYEIGFEVEVIDIGKDKVEIRAFNRHAGYAYKVFGEFAMNAEFKKFFLTMRSEDAKEKDAAIIQQRKEDLDRFHAAQEYKNIRRESNGGTGIRL